MAKIHDDAPQLEGGARWTAQRGAARPRLQGDLRAVVARILRAVLHDDCGLDWSRTLDRRVRIDSGLQCVLDILRATDVAAD
jgi:hypothetical protein